MANSLVVLLTRAYRDLTEIKYNNDRSLADHETEMSGRFFDGRTETAPKSYDSKCQHDVRH